MSEARLFIVVTGEERSHGELHRSLMYETARAQVTVEGS